MLHSLTHLLPFHACYTLKFCGKCHGCCSSDNEDAVRGFLLQQVGLTHSVAQQGAQMNAECFVEAYITRSNRSNGFIHSVLCRSHSRSALYGEA
jgi:hypothetical protein